MHTTFRKFITPLMLAVPMLFSLSSAADKVITDDLNLFFSDLDETFARIAESGALKSTRLRPAERLFVREMRKNRAFFTFIRTNTKGAVISEVVRGEKAVRPMRDISDQTWFRRVMRQKEPYYSLIKDSERGRYYLFWARPILKRNDRCVGTVLLKIDLWDSFYEFSNDLYFPFLIKLGRTSLFSHKWKDISGAKEEQLTVQGIRRITVTYIPEKKAAEPAVSAPPQTTPDSSAFSVADTKPPEPAKSTKKKGSSGVLIFFVVILVIAIVGASAMLIAWMKRRALLRHIDEDDII